MIYRVCPYCHEALHHPAEDAPRLVACPCCCKMLPAFAETSAYQSQSLYSSDLRGACGTAATSVLMGMLDVGPFVYLAMDLSRTVPLPFLLAGPVFAAIGLLAGHIAYAKLDWSEEEREIRALAVLGVLTNYAYVVLIIWLHYFFLAVEMRHGTGR